VSPFLLFVILAFNSVVCKFQNALEEVPPLKYIPALPTSQVKKKKKLKTGVKKTEN